MDEHEKIYQRIGEFVVSFQWSENRFREIGWLILDPKRTEWPPRALRNETNHDLLNKVKSLFVDLIDQLDISDNEDRKKDFTALVDEFHEMRRYRNSLLHSAYMELKSGDEVVGLMRENPKLKFDLDSDKPKFDQEWLSESGMMDRMKELGNIVFKLNMHYMQLIHWAPFDCKRDKA